VTDRYVDDLTGEVWQAPSDGLGESLYIGSESDALLIPERSFRNYRPGERFLFSNTGHDGHELLDHDGQVGVIVRQLSYVWPAGATRPDLNGEVDVEVGPMYALRFDDGTEINAFADELTEVPQ
jgi:hypothetical protein